MLKYLASALLGTGLSAMAQIAPPLVPTNPGAVVKVMLAPPKEFNALTAQPQELERYGLPPKPDQIRDAKSFELWQKAVTNKTFVQPAVEQTRIYHRPAKVTNKPAQLSDNTQPLPTEAIPTPPSHPVAYSYNWSGVVAYAPTNPFQISAVYGYFIVPAVEHAFGVRNGAWDYCGEWVGIDGFGSGDVMQAGIEADAFASASTSSSFYSFWLEWFPYPEIQIGNFPLGPGDTVFAEVWNTSPTNAYCYLVNFSTNQAAAFNFTAPPGTRLVGNSAEWVVERPEVGGLFATLSNYVGEAWVSCVALGRNRTVGYYPGLVPAGTILYDLTMLDNQGHPISVPSLTGTASIWFWDEGSAR
jgi:hypothetical protein